MAYSQSSLAERSCCVRESLCCSTVTDSTAQLCFLTQQVAAIQQNLQVFVTDHFPSRCFYFPERDTQVGARHYSVSALPHVPGMIRLVGAGASLPLGASGLQQLHQLVQVDAAFTLVQFRLLAFELICVGQQRQEGVVKPPHHGSVHTPGAALMVNTKVLRGEDAAHSCG